MLLLTFAHSFFKKSSKAKIFISIPADYKSAGTLVLLLHILRHGKQ